MQEFKCAKCNETFLVLDTNYVHACPTGSDIAIEQARLHHDAHVCPHRADNDVVDLCPHCGQEIGRWDVEYVTTCPTGSDMAREQANIEHWSYCPVQQAHAWIDWRKETNALPGETPLQLLARLRLNGLSRARLLDVQTPPDRYCNGVDLGWDDEICQWWTDRGPLSGEEYSRAKANGWT
jgi:predicted RNA-binding Zn-ribbon protein involved in translation (DUF1610 family)